jgi:hypothetical protein
MERKTIILVCVVLFIGLAGGYTLGTLKAIGKHVDTEYFLELKPKSVMIESIDGYIYECPIDSIPAVLLRDNL